MTTILDIFMTPTAIDLAVRELQEAQREHLRACSALEYAQAVVDYNASRIARLETLVQSRA